MRRCLVRLALVGVALMLMAGGAVRGQVLDQVPGDAVLVIKFNNLQQTSNKAGVLAQQWGLAAMSPEMQDPLSAILNRVKLTAGVNKAGDAAFVMLGGQGQAEPKGLFLVPVADYQAFLGNFPDTKVQGEVASFTLPDGGRTAYAAKWGNYAAISNEKEALANKPGGLKVGGLAGRELQSKDVVLFANMPALRDRALPELQKARVKMVAELNRQAATTRPAPTTAEAQKRMMLPAAKALVNRVLDVAEGFMTDARGVTVGINLSGEGISSTTLVEFEPTSYAGRIVGALKNTNQNLLVGLPDEKYVMLGGCTVDSQTLAKLVDDFMSPISGELDNSGTAGKKIQDYISAMKQTLTASRSEAFGAVAPAGNIGMESLLQTVTVISGDAATMLESQRKMIATQEAIQDVFGNVKANKVTITDNAKTVDGVNFTQYQVQFGATGRTPQEMQAAQMMKMLFGPKGMVFYTGVVDPKHVVSVSGGNEMLLADAVVSVKSGNDPVIKLGASRQWMRNCRPTVWRWCTCRWTCWRRRGRTWPDGSAFRSSCSYRRICRRWDRP